MFTYKQLEALYWIAELNGFAAAARKLNTTQSAISKRVQELESSLGAPLFDRAQRNAKLSERGAEVLHLAKRLLEQRDAAIEQLSNPAVISRRVRIGVTELTAITWLPRFVRLLRKNYPKIVVEPDVDASVNLRDRLLADEMDLIIVPEVVAQPRLAKLHLGTVQLVWMCKPGLLPTSRLVSQDELAATTILTQGGTSGTAILFEPWLRPLALAQARTINSNNMLALIGFTVAGIGVSYLPRACLQPLIDRRALAVLKTSPALPLVNYVALYRSGGQSSLMASIANLAQEVCDFSTLFQTSAFDAKDSTDLGVALFGGVGAAKSGRRTRAR